MSQALGLMADLDLGTENLRWMGDTRFVVGLFRGGWCVSLPAYAYPHSYLVIQWKPCPVQLSYKAVESDKFKMVETLNAKRLANKNSQPSTPLDEDATLSTTIPPLKYSMEDTDGWTTFDKPLLYVYAGKGPYVGR